MAGGAFTDNLDVNIGAYTKASDYDKVADNAEFCREKADLEHDFAIGTGLGKHKAINPLIKDAAAAAIKDLITMEWDPASGTPAVGQGVALVGKMSDSANNQQDFGRLELVTTNVTNGAEASRWDAKVISGGSLSTAFSAVPGGIAVGLSTLASGARIQVKGGFIVIEDASSNAGASVRFLGSNTTPNWLIGNQTIDNDAFQIAKSTTNGGSTFTSALATWKGATGFLGIFTNSPRSQVHIDAGTQDISIGTLTESNFSLLIEGDSNTEVGVGFTGVSSNSPTASIGAVRGTSGGVLVFRTSSSYGSNNLERVRIDKDGFVVIGDTTDVHLGDGGSPKKLTVLGPGAGAYGLLKLLSDQTGNGATMGAITFGTTGATTAASNEKRTALIASTRRGASATTTPAGDLAFFTSAGTNGVAPAQRLLLDEKGNIVVGTAALATGATDGFLLITTSAGAPTGTPTAYTGRAQLHYDTTNNKIYIWNPVSAAWKQTAALT